MLKWRHLLWTPVLLMTAFVAAQPAIGAPPTNGLVGYWPFNGNANDESGNGNHGTVQNGAALTSDRAGNTESAYFFDAVDDSIDLGIVSSLQPQLPVTIAAWVRFTDAPSPGNPSPLFVNSDHSTNYCGVGLSFVHVGTTPMIPTITAVIPMEVIQNHRAGRRR
jgi:hypothetical protein